MALAWQDYWKIRTLDLVAGGMSVRFLANPPVLGKPFTFTVTEDGTARYRMPWLMLVLWVMPCGMLALDSPIHDSIEPPESSGLAVRGGPPHSACGPRSLPAPWPGPILSPARGQDCRALRCW